MSTAVLRLVITGWILLTLVRASRAAWRQRPLVTTIWHHIRLRHVVGSLGLLVLVGAAATIAIGYVPGMHYGLGDLVGFSGNAVFVPLEEAVSRAGPAPAAGPDLALLALATLFLGGLVLLLPWLAFVEEEVFRAGLETAGTARQVRSALVFGAAHLVMLVPLGAALAIGLAGYVYGRIYLRAHRHHDLAALPEPVAAAFRPTRRSSAAADQRRAVAVPEPRRPAAAPATAVGAAVDRTPEQRQALAVLASTVWHTTFNTTVVALVWVGIVIAALRP